MYVWRKDYMYAKSKRKAISWIVSLATVISLFAGLTLTAFAEPTYSRYTSDTAISTGDTVTVTLSVPDSTKLAAFKQFFIDSPNLPYPVSLNFEDSQLTYVSTAWGGMVSSFITSASTLVTDKGTDTKRSPYPSSVGLPPEDKNHQLTTNYKDSAISIGVGGDFIIWTFTANANIGVGVLKVDVTDQNRATTAVVTVEHAGGESAVEAEAPTINVQPASSAYTQNIGATALSVSASKSDEGTLSYQWYSNTVNSNSGGTIVSGATSSSYTPLTTTVGTKYYYVIVTNTLDTDAQTTTSDAVAITVTAPTSAYTVSAVSNATPKANGDNFAVDISVSATLSTAFTQLRLELQYDSTKVEFYQGTVATGLSGTHSVVVGDPTGSGDIKTVVITHLGDTLNAVSAGVKVATVMFKPIAQGSATFSVASPQIGLSENKTELTGVSAATVGTDKVITIAEATAPTPETPDITVISNWSGAPAGYSLVVLTSTTNPEYGYYDGQSDPLYYSSKLSAKATVDAGEDRFVYLTIRIGTPSAPTLWSSSAIHEGVAGQAKGVVTYDGNLNGSGGVDIFDAQIAYDLSVGKYASGANPLNGQTGALTIAKRLAADINGDGEVTVADARAIQWYYHFGTFDVPG
jgi:hypothetical protein